MKQFTTISQSLFDERAREAANKTPIRREFGLKDIEVINSETLTLDGKQVGMSNEAFKNFCKIVGLPVGFDKTFSSAFGDKARQQLVNRLKVAAQAKGNSSVSIVLNPETKKIIAVQKDPRDLVSNQSFLESTTRMINQFDLEVSDFSVSDDGSVVINTASPKNAWGIQGLKDEDHFGGISFSNSPNNGFQVSPFLYRLVCANGMIGRSFSETMQLGQMDQMNLLKFNENLEALAKRGFRPEKFEERVRLAMNTRASLAEMEHAHGKIMAVSDADVKEIESWIPYQQTKASFFKSGVDVNTLTTNQMKGAKTGMTIWEMINSITHFATHDNGFKMKSFNRRTLQTESSRILCDNFDMANLIASPF
jgi:hypothetical protein